MCGRETCVVDKVPRTTPPKGFYEHAKRNDIRIGTNVRTLLSFPFSSYTLFKLVSPYMIHLPTPITNARLVLPMLRLPPPPRTHLRRYALHALRTLCSGKKDLWRRDMQETLQTVGANREGDRAGLVGSADGVGVG
jgi:hypothetical protein